MKTEYRNAAAAKQKLHRAWAAEPEPDIDDEPYEDPSLQPTAYKDQCTRCGATWHGLADCTLPVGD